MRLIQFHINGEEYFVNPDKITYVHKHEEEFRTVLMLHDETFIAVDETLKTTIARIGNDELNVAYDCMREIERLKQTIKNLQRNTQPSE